MEYEKWIKRIRKSMQKMEIGQKFILKDLFDDDEWSSISKGKRVALGRFFAENVRSGQIEGIEFCEPKKGACNKYKKIFK